MNKFTTQEIKQLIPTVTIRGEKPVHMQWLTQTDAITAMRNVETARDDLWQAEVLRLNERIDELQERIRRMKVSLNNDY